MRAILRIISVLICVALAVSCSKESTPQTPSKKGTILMLLGSKISYWDQIYYGGKEEGEKENYDVKIVYRDADTVNTSIINTLNNIGDIPDLKGIVMMPGDKSVEDLIVLLNIKAPVVIVDQKLNENSTLQSSVRTTVVADNEGLGRDISKRIQEKKVLTLCYPIGGSYDRSLALQEARGKEFVDMIVVSDARAAKDSIAAYVNEHNGEEYAVAFATGSFINNETMKLLAGKKVYAVDMSDEIQKDIENGSIEFTAIPSTFEMGAKAVHFILDKSICPAIQYISVVYANKDNVHSKEVQRFLK